jgi:hypothetical protein
MPERLNRDQLIELVGKIIAVRGTEKEIDSWVRIFAANVPHPEASGLIFWSSRYGLGRSPTAEEIVDKALSYRPIQL